MRMHKGCCANQNPVRPQIHGPWFDDDQLCPCCGSGDEVPAEEVRQLRFNLAATYASDRAISRAQAFYATNEKDTIESGVLWLAHYEGFIAGMEAAQCPGNTLQS